MVNHFKNVILITTNKDLNILNFIEKQLSFIIDFFDIYIFIYILEGAMAPRHRTAQNTSVKQCVITDRAQREGDLRDR